MTKDAKHLIIEKLFPNENANKIVDKLENKKNYDPKYTSLLGKLNTITIDMIKKISDLTFNKFYIILHLCEDKNRNINDLLSEEAKSNKNILFYKIEGNIDTSSMLNVPITILYNKNSIIKGWYIGTNLIKIKNVTNINKTKVNYAKNLNISIKSNKIIIDFISYESVYKYGALAVAGVSAGTVSYYTFIKLKEEVNKLKDSLGNFIENIPNPKRYIDSTILVGRAIFLINYNKFDICHRLLEMLNNKLNDKFTELTKCMPIDDLTKVNDDSQIELYIITYKTWRN